MTQDITIREYQTEIGAWTTKAFSEGMPKELVDTALSVEERRNRFMEESIELFQALGGSQSMIDCLSRHVYSKPIGDPKQEVGGVMVTLSSLCTSAKIDLVEAAVTELRRIWIKIDVIRFKHINKPRDSVLPGRIPDDPGTDTTIGNVRVDVFGDSEERIRGKTSFFTKLFRNV